MSVLGKRLVLALAVVLASLAPTRLVAQETAEGKACAQLLPAIESLKVMLGQEARARTAENETQRMQLVMTLLGLRYHNIEALQSSLRSTETAEDDLHGAMARNQAQIDMLDEAARNAAASPPDPERKAQRAEADAVMKGLEERVKGLRERKASYQGQLAVELHDIEKLETLVRGWIEKTP